MVRPKLKEKDKKKKIFNRNDNDKLLKPKNTKKPGAYKKFIRNPNVSHLNIDSHFIYSDFDFKKKFQTLQNKNLLKLNEKEELFLSQKIMELRVINSINNNEEFVSLKISMAEKIKNFKPQINVNDELTSFIKNKILSSPNRSGISCRKLSTMYKNETGKYACKTKINNIIKNKLGYHFLKTSKKSNFLLTDYGTVLCFTFIKTLIRILRSGFEILFIDESSIQMNNSNFRCWSKYNEQIHLGLNLSIKLNLLLCISKDEIIYYELNQQNTNSSVFLDFMKKINEYIKKNQKNKYVIIMDNFSAHKSEVLYEFYKNEKINILFNI